VVWLEAPGGGGVAPGGGGLVAGAPGGGEAAPGVDGGGLATPGGGDGVEPGQQQVDPTRAQTLMPPLMEISGQTTLFNRARGGRLWPAGQLPADATILSLAMHFIDPVMFRLPKNSSNYCNTLLEKRHGGRCTWSIFLITQNSHVQGRAAWQ